VAQREVQQRVDAELRRVAEPYRTTLILRDLEEMSYEEIAEILQISSGNCEIQIDARPAGAEKAAGAVCARGRRMN
jgi:DNA-directed RNA polymerase specialized sigma24 family protein